MITLIHSYDIGLEALLFSSQGDMRHALNNLQSTVAGFGAVTAENVFKVVDQPHPVVVSSILQNCQNGDVEEALTNLQVLTAQGYAGIDIIGTIFRVTKNLTMDEKVKLSFIREIGSAHMRMADGVDSLLQLTSLVARLCALRL